MRHVSDLIAALSEQQVTAYHDEIKAAVRPTATRLQRTSYRLSHDQSWELDVLRADGAPRPDTRTAISSGLSNCSWTRWNFPDRIELIHTWSGTATENETLVVTAAETMILTNPAKPGLVILDAVKAAGLAVADRMPHALISFPYLREWTLDKVVAGDARIWLMQVTPIFEQEAKFIDANGFAKWEELLSYDVMDLHRLDRGSHVR
jgi:suppressor of fused protein SUFU